MEEKIKSLRIAADIHKQVRKMVKDDIKPGAKILDYPEYQLPTIRSHICF